MNVRRTLPSLAGLIAIGALAAACSTPSSTAGWTYGPTIAPQVSASPSVAPSASASAAPSASPSAGRRAERVGRPRARRPVPRKPGRLGRRDPRTERDPEAVPEPERRVPAPPGSPGIRPQTASPSSRARAGPPPTTGPRSGRGPVELARDYQSARCMTDTPVRQMCAGRTLGTLAGCRIGLA